jgi:hypothetical protein
VEEVASRGGGEARDHLLSEGTIPVARLLERTPDSGYVVIIADLDPHEDA